MAIDVFTRIVLGFYLTLEPPSVTSIGLRVSQPCLHKVWWPTHLVGVNRSATLYPDAIAIPFTNICPLSLIAAFNSQKMEGAIPFNGNTWYPFGL